MTTNRDQVFITPLIEAIDSILPQTQCTKCGYEGCLPYAQAIALEQAPINRCPPGGQEGIKQLADLLNKPEIPLDASCGEPRDLQVAVIDEAHCIGCTLCIRACPVQAIVGVNKFMHTVLPELCSGCELCVAPCPVDCIQMVPANRQWTEQDRHSARERHIQQNKRRALAEEQKNTQAKEQTSDGLKQDLIAKALAKARMRRQGPQ